MLLLNFIRAMLLILVLVVIDITCRAKDVEGVPYYVIIATLLTIAFTAGDLIEERLVAHFNKDLA